MQITKCPVCEGRGIVKPEFYYEPSEKGPQKCRACEGRGIFKDAPFYTNPPLTHPNPYVSPSTWTYGVSTTAIPASREKPNEITLTGADGSFSFGTIGD